MAQAVQSISTSVKFRLPREMLAGLEQWATEHGMPRSKAIRVLCYRAMAGDWTDFDGCTCENPDQCAGTCRFCDCIGGPDTCTGNCR
jgi:hypothetical protein